MGAGGTGISAMWSGGVGWRLWRLGDGIWARRGGLRLGLGLGLGLGGRREVKGEGRGVRGEVKGR